MALADQKKVILITPDLRFSLQNLPIPCAFRRRPPTEATFLNFLFMLAAIPIGFLVPKTNIAMKK